ncbi:MAG: histone deacetylase family protein [Acidibrevibacterium sp.]|uniref:histone deacetylase family protein n=1 Tax=Acidibrevibacterium sp. TaxID=2606776 RepID=UPI003D01D581
MSVALFTHLACLDHDPGGWHPECPDRLRAVLRALEAPEFASLLREEAPPARHEQLTRVHGADYVAAILATRPAAGEIVPFDADTVMSRGSAEAALRAAGGAAAAVDAVMEGWARAAFVAVRPPGHHAEPGRAMGFCFFNNAAIAAQQARARWGLRRVAVVDFDVHHGNGTEAAFAADPDLFYASSHQYPCYPGTGAARGIADHIVNVPLAPGSDGGNFRTAWEGVILPALDAFAPELLIISAGFDAHHADPLAELRLTERDFAWVSEKLVACAKTHARGRIVSVLEGGYNLEALAASAAVHIRALMGI